MIKIQILLVSIGCLLLVSCASQPSTVITDENQICKIARAIVLQREKWPDPEKTPVPAPGYPGLNEFLCCQVEHVKDGRWLVAVHKAVSDRSGGCGFLDKGRFLTLSPSGKLIHYKTLPDGPGVVTPSGKIIPYKIKNGEITLDGYKGGNEGFFF